jgi:DNA-binding CsgD family transcriptional regulator
MLEREAATGAVGELLDATRSGRGSALFIVGEAGLGKTTVLDLSCRLAGSGWRVGMARGDVMETALPFGLIGQAVDVLGGGEVLRETIPASSPHDARASRFYRTLRWLSEAAADGPVLLGIDDLHWSDGDSLALISYICRRLAPFPVAIIGTLRPWPPAAEGVCLQLVGAGHARVERLSALSEQAARALLVDRLGHDVAPEVVETAWESTAGNPLLLEQVAVALGSCGTAVVPAGHLEHSSVLLRRFGGLPAVGLRLAQAASVLGNRFRPELALTLAHEDGEDATLALDALSRSGLIRRAGEGMAQFIHPHFRQVLYDDLPALVREALHGRAFRLLKDRDLEAEAAEHAVLGNLFGDEDAVQVLERAGCVALRTGAVTTAIERLEAGARLAGAHAGPELLSMLGEAHAAEGHGPEAVAVYQRLLGLNDVPATIRVNALQMLGRALIMIGDETQGRLRFEEAARVAGRDHPALSVLALLDLSRAAWLTGGPARALPVVDRARALASNLDVAVGMEVEAAWGFVAFVNGDRRGLDAAIEAGRWSAANHVGVLRDLSWHWGARRNGGRAAKYAERFAESEAVFANAFPLAEQTGSPQAIVSLAAHHADTLVRQGRLADADTFATRAVGLAELAPIAAAFAYVVKALVLLEQHRLEESEQFCHLAESAAQVRGQWLPLLRVGHLRARRHFDEGDVERACRLYEVLAAETARLGIGEPCLVPWAGHAVLAHLRLKRVAEAERVIAWLETCAGRLPCCWPRIAAGLGRARLAAASGDNESAEAEFRGALALLDEVDLPLERVETLLQWGSFLRRDGRVTEARDVLREALAHAESMGAAWLARPIHAELTVAGGRRRRRRDQREQLTAQEQRVAHLAAAGRSSAEIAGDLSLSVRTIETHLGRIYAKLGIHSQRELMATPSLLRRASRTSEQTREG